MEREPTSIFYILGKKAGYWIAANRHRFIRNLIGSIIRALPGGGFLSRLFR